MLLKRWEPFTELRKLDTEMDRMWKHAFQPFHTWPPYWHANGHVDIDVYQDADNLMVWAAQPGVKPEDAEVTVAGGTLTIKGEPKLEKQIKEEEYLHREHRYGAFHRTVALHRELDPEKAEATCDNGILTVTIPRSEERKHKPLKINIKALEESKRWNPTIPDKSHLVGSPAICLWSPLPQVCNGPIMGCELCVEG